MRLSDDDITGGSATGGGRRSRGRRREPGRPRRRRGRRRGRRGSGRRRREPGRPATAARTAARGGEGPADGGANPGGHDGGADGSAPVLSESHAMTHQVPGGDAPPGTRPLRRRRADKFAAAYWGQQPLLSRADELAGPDGFTDLLSPGRGRRVAQPARPAHPVPAGRPAGHACCPPARFTGSGGAGAEVGDQVLDERDHAPVRGRRHPGPAGPAPDLAAADRLRPRARHRAAASRCRSTPT